MKLVTYQSDTGPRSGVVSREDGDSFHVVDLNHADSDLPTSLKELLESGESALRRVQKALDKSSKPAVENPALLPVIPDPQKIICVGLNYADHAAETGAKVGDEPVIFNKFPSTLRGHEQTIELPAVSAQVDYEAELVVVIGSKAKNVRTVDSRSHIAGYCCGHDVSARDWQKGKPGKQWLLGKSFDTFAPLGPWLVTADEIAEPESLSIQMRLNGKVMQSSSTKELIFKLDFLVSYLSSVCTLLPGDLIYTGTPPGVGMARTPPVFLKPGDIVEVEVEQLGVLRNAVVAAS